MKWLYSVLLAACVGLQGQVSSETPGWAVFDVPGLEAAAGTPVDVSYLNTEPAGTHGFIRVENGKFVDDRGTPLRFFGTNVTGDACFPAEEDAPKLAKRLRQYGFNCLRLHFMDTNWHKGAIWQDPMKSEFNETNLRKLDRFVACCIQEGIYLNVNLHVARTYPGCEGIRDRNFGMGKKLDRWYPKFIDLQEDYAKKLLGRVNTVTGKRYADTPGIMCIELNNENTMIGEWRESLWQLPQAFQDEFTAQWTRWLKRRYGTDAALRKSWDRHVTPLGEEVVTDAKGWVNENAGGAVSTVTPLADGGWRWEATKTGTESWNLQLEIKGIKLPPGAYTVTFEARSDASSEMSHHIMLNAPPWQNLGLTYRFKLTPEWTRYEIYNLVAPAVNDNQHRVNFSLGNRLGDMEIRNYRIRRGGGHGLSKEQSVETRVKVPDQQAHITQMQDFHAFLIDTEMATTRRLRDYVKNTLGCRMPVTDTQVNYGQLGGLKRETELSDYIDIHAYWEHPSYISNEKGQRTGFTIRNTAAVASDWGGCIPNLASWRVAGKPFSVSEHNTPAPNDHCADQFPLYSVIASIQDWDAYFSYTYRDFGTDYGNTYIRGYFQFIGRASMLVHVPFAALLYRRGLMPVSTQETVIGIPDGRLAAMVNQRRDMTSILTKLGGGGLTAVSRRMANRLVPEDGEPRLLKGSAEPMLDAQGATVSADGSFRMWPKDPQGACATLNLPSARLVSGHIAGRTFELGDVRIAVAERPWPKPLPAFSCVSLIALDGKPVAASGRLLLALSARTENTGMNWNDKRTTLLGKKREETWGKPPVVSELVPAVISLPWAGMAKLTVLDGQGRSVSSRQVPAENVAVTAADQSLWYLLER